MNNFAHRTNWLVVYFRWKREKSIPIHESRLLQRTQPLSICVRVTVDTNNI